MIAIFKREFKSYYSGMMGWLLTGVMLLFGGLYFTAANLQGGYTNFTISLYSFVIVLLIFIPLTSVLYALLREWMNERIKEKKIPKEKYQPKSK